MSAVPPHELSDQEALLPPPSSDAQPADPAASTESVAGEEDPGAALDTEEPLPFKARRTP